MFVKEAFTHTYGHGGTVDVPAGARTTRAFQDETFRWVDPSIFPAGSFARYDAEYYGILVPRSNITEETPSDLP